MISSRHGAITEIKLNGIASDKKSMSMVCEDLNLMKRWHNNELEGGKGYPDKEAKGTFPGFPDDVVSVVPPADGHILSGGHTDARDCVNFTNQEMRIKTENTNFNWADTAIKVKSGDVFETKWTYSAQHKTRGYDWWITEKPIDFSHRLTRDDLKEQFYKDYSIDTPFWSYPLRLCCINKICRARVVIIW